VCNCSPGFCAKNNGAGYGVCVVAGNDTLTASVKPVNQEMPQFPSPHNQVTVGLAFSGGGSRALTVTLGAYRALEDLRLMSNVDAISSVSGGTWASSIYMFADMSKEELLGPATVPAALTMEALQQTPAALGNAVTRSMDSWVEDMLAKGMLSTDMWPNYVGETVLEPFGLNEKNSFIAGSIDEVERIRQENPPMSEQSFLVPQPGRPKVFVMGGTILAPVGYMPGPDSIASFQMSPDFTGSPFWPNGSNVSYKPASGTGLTDLQGVLIGGGFVDTYAFGDSAPQDHQSGGDEILLHEPKKPFNLPLAVGISSAAGAALLANWGGTYQYILPQVPYWPVPPKGFGEVSSRTYLMGDGGNIENSGLLALVQRGVKRAVMWVSTYIPLRMDIDFCSAFDPSVFNNTDPLVSAPMVFDKFGYQYQDAGSIYTNNHIFPREDVGSVFCGLQSLKLQGRPLVHRSKHNVIPNTWWGIKGGWELDLVIVYNDQSTEFENALPAETQEAFGGETPQERTDGEFAHFPLYNTLDQTGITEFTQLTTAQVNLLAAQSEFFIRKNEALFREVLR